MTARRYVFFYAGGKSDEWNLKLGMGDWRMGFESCDFGL